MKIEKIRLSEILTFLGEKVLNVTGNIGDVYIDDMSDASHVVATSIDWINPNKVNKQKIAEHSLAKVILVDNSIEYSENLSKANKILIQVDNPKLVLALIVNKFFTKKRLSEIHPSAIVSSSAKIGMNVYIGPHCFIENCIIGDNCIIDSNVHIYDDVQIGNSCVIKSGAVIGGEGFGFERDMNGNLFRFPQIGDVKIGHHVEVGANTCIDRGALSTTIIGDYTKINNLCHIAHNNVIGNNVVIAAEVNVSGGNKIEDNVWIAPSSSIRGYLTIGENTTIGMGAVVVKNIPSDEVWVGNPAKKIIKDR